MYKLLIIYVATFIQTTFCQYTEESEKNSIRMWLQPQIGISGSGFAGAIEIDAAYKAFMVGLRGESESELCIFCTKVDRKQTNFLLGFSKVIEGSGSFSFLAGVSHFTGHKRGTYMGKGEFLDFGDGYEQLSYEGIGVPLEFSILAGKDGIRFGLTIFIDINSENPTGGFFIGIPIGKLKS